MQVPTNPQIVALAGAVKSKDLSAAKKSLEEGSVHDVDFACRITGLITKGVGEPASEGESPAHPNLNQAHIHLDVLRRLKITPGQLRKALRQSAKLHDQPARSDPETDALHAVYAEEADRLAAELPPVPWSRTGKAGSCRTDGVSCALIDVPAQRKPSRKAA